jgi:hypothetical protein
MPAHAGAYVRMSVRAHEIPDQKNEGKNLIGEFFYHGKSLIIMSGA